MTGPHGDPRVGPADDSAAVRRLAEVEALSGIGSWEWEIAADRLEWSEQLRRIYGVDEGAELGYEDFIERVHAEDRDDVQAIVRRALESRSAFAIEHRIVRSDGAVRDIHSRGYVLLGTGGVPERMLGSAQDVTDARAAELERTEAEKRAAAGQARDEALALIAHDLRSPLAVVVGYIQLLERQAAGGTVDIDKLNPYLERIDTAARQMTSLLDDLLTDAELDAGTEPIQRQPIDLVPRLRGLVEHHDAISSHHTVEADVPDAPVVAEVNLPKLERALHNLLVNAIKYSPGGGTVTLGLVGEADRVRITVTDRGIGIPAADLPRIYDRFHRGSNVSGRTSGLGLGLVSVKRAVDAHGGSVEVESREGEGTTFTIELPRGA